MLITISIAKENETETFEITTSKGYEQYYVHWLALMKIWSSDENVAYVHSNEGSLTIAASPASDEYFNVHNLVCYFVHLKKKKKKSCVFSQLLYIFFVCLLHSNITGRC